MKTKRTPDTTGKPIEDKGQTRSDPGRNVEVDKKGFPPGPLIDRDRMASDRKGSRSRQ